MKHRTAFALIELMVVLTIISVLAALAIPSFQQFVVKAKRTQAQAALMALMHQQERYYTQNNTYLAFSSDATDGGQFRPWSGDTAAHSAYEIQALACPGVPIAQCVRLIAIPGTDKVDRHFRDSSCETLTLDSTGQRGASGAAPHCWP
jgi:type IV pilus assembly protein PilE